MLTVGGTYIFDTPFDVPSEYQNDVIYAYKKKDLEQAIESYSNFIIHASVGNAKQIINEYSQEMGHHLYVLFLTYDSALSESFFEKRCPHQRGTDAFNKRFLHAKKEINFLHDNTQNGTNIFSSVFRADDPYEMCEQLEKFILPKLEVMPTSPDKIPGPLSDTDLLYTYEHRKSDRLQVIVSNNNAGNNTNVATIPVDEFRKMMCGSGLNLTLDKKIRRLKTGINSLIDMSVSIDDMDIKLKHSFVEDNISGGYLLKPNEIILCTTNERIKVPKDMYAIIATRFSYSQLGLSIELGTSVIQAGHDGKIHFQIKNQTPNTICIFPNISVIQLIFFRTILPSSINTVAVSQDEYCSYHEPPLSQFRKKDSKLDNVRKKPNLLSKLLNEVITGRIIAFLGAVVMIVPLLLWGKSIINYCNQLLINLNISDVDMVDLLIIAFLILIINCLFYIVGQLVVNLFKKIKLLLFRIFTFGSSSGQGSP